MRIHRAPSGQGGHPRTPQRPVGTRARTRRSYGLAASIFLLASVLPIALGLLACASGPPIPVAPGPFEPLAKDEGFFIVHVDTEVAIERLEASNRVVARDLQAGEHLWVVRMKAGRYRWTRVRFVPQRAQARSIQTRSMDILDQREFEFEIEAGQINYAGEILVRVRDQDQGLASGFSFRNRNHSALAIRTLRKTHPELVDSLPLRYAGMRGDGFLEFYTQARRAVAEGRVGNASPKAGPE